MLLLSLPWWAQLSFVLSCSYWAPLVRWRQKKPLPDWHWAVSSVFPLVAAITVWCWLGSGLLDTRYSSLGLGLAVAIVVNMVANGLLGRLDFGLPLYGAALLLSTFILIHCGLHEDHAFLRKREDSLVVLQDGTQEKLILPRTVSRTVDRRFFEIRTEGAIWTIPISSNSERVIDAFSAPVPTGNSGLLLVTWNPREDVGDKKFVKHITYVSPPRWR